LGRNVLFLQKARYPSVRNKYTQSNIPHLLFVGLCLIFIVGCGSTKKKDSAKQGNGFVGFWHTFTGYFNGYYHAEQRYKEGVKSIEKTTVIPESGFVVLVPGASAGGASSPQFDKAIEKCDMVIVRKKKGKYVDDSYYMKGRCNYYKRNFPEAITNFNFILSEYPKTPLYNEVNFWLAKCYLATDNGYRSRELLKPISDKKFKDKRTQIEMIELFVTLAVEDKAYQDAIKSLEDNIQSVKPRTRKARWHFLLGQLYDELKDYENARRNFEQVVKMNTENELVFRARMNLANLYVKYNQGAGGAEFVRAELEKMLEDAKYDDFQDQIYYQLGLIAQKNKDNNKALAHFINAFNKNGKNQQIHALAGYQAGMIYFRNQSKLDSAQKYFDEAAKTIPEKDPEADRIKALSKTLKRYQEYKNTLKDADKLEELSRLGNDELVKKAEKIILEEEEEKKKRIEQKKQEEMRERSKMSMSQMNQMQNQQLLASNANLFYFDDPTRVSMGKADFNKVWGSRPNEDHWRRRNKATSFGDEESATNDELLDLSRAEDRKKFEERRDKLIKRVPRSTEDKNKLQQKISTTLFDLSQLFSGTLSMPDSAGYYYDQLLKRYPNDPLAPKTHYALYTLFEETNAARANKSKSTILSKWPESIYARLLRKEELKKDDLPTNQESFESAYTNLYNLYQAGDYETVINFSKFVIEQYLADPQVSKAYYIRGLAFGKMNKMDSLRTTFNFINPSSQTHPQLFKR
jgi:tetratricopeptide (TPR) repeat protein